MKPPHKRDALLLIYRDKYWRPWPSRSSCKQNITACL